jgi:hypothetical protein
LSGLFFESLPIRRSKITKNYSILQKNQPILAILKNATVILFANYC